jgi:hypothetical protein
LFKNSEAKSYLDLSSLFFFFFRGRLTPNVPLHIFPRFVFLSPLPKADSSFFKGNVIKLVRDYLIGYVINIISKAFYVNNKMNLTISAFLQGYLLFIHSVPIGAIDILALIF